MARLAPPEAMGRDQIIPSRGDHEQIYPTKEQIRALVALGKIDYDEEYGPGARVYRPVGAADAKEVSSWMA